MVSVMLIKKSPRTKPRRNESLLSLLLSLSDHDGGAESGNGGENGDSGNVTGLSGGSRSGLGGFDGSFGLSRCGFFHDLHLGLSLVERKADAGKIQSGDWLVFNGGQYGHVGMALGPVVNGYVALLGENQGGGYCQGGGAATNIINISIKNLIGYYRPKTYVKPEPKPTPAPTPDPTPSVDRCKKREVVKGDTLGKIMKECEGKIQWGSAMNEYASHWYSIKFKKYLTVYNGWTSQNGVGLFAGDTIEYRAN